VGGAATDDCRPASLVLVFAGAAGKFGLLLWAGSEFLSLSTSLLAEGTTSKSCIAVMSTTMRVEGGADWKRAALTPLTSLLLTGISREWPSRTEFGISSTTRSGPVSFMVLA